jgi:hypothetical protein
MISHLSREIGKDDGFLATKGAQIKYMDGRLLAFFRYCS